MVKPQELYSKLKADGFTDLPDYVTFQTALQDKGKREQLHTALSRYYDDIPNFETFDTSLGARNRTIPEKIGDTARAGLSAVTGALDRVVDPEKIETRSLGGDVATAIDVAKKAPGFVGNAAMAGLYGASAGTVGAVRGVVEPMNRYVAKPVYESVTGQKGAETDKISQALADYQNSIQQSADAVMPQDPSGVASGIASAAQMGANLPLMVMNPAAGLTVMGVQTGGQAYGEARNAGASPLQSFLHGASQGGIEVATESIPALRLVSNLKASAPLSKLVVDLLSSEMPQEQIATALQDLNDWATLHPERPFSEYLRDRPTAAGQTAVATVVGAGLISGTAHIANRVIQGSPERQVSRAIDQSVAETRPEVGQQPQPIVRQGQPMPLPANLSMAARVQQKLDEKRRATGQPQTATPTPASGPRSGLSAAIIQQESGWNRNAVNRKSGATGIYQITPSFLADGNRFLGTSYTMQDMKDPAKASAITQAWHDHYSAQFERDNGRKPTEREIAMMHHGGPKGYLRPDAADQEGVTNAEYADQVLARMGGSDEPASVDLAQSSESAPDDAVPQASGVPEEEPQVEPPPLKPSAMQELENASMLPEKKPATKQQAQIPDAGKMVERDEYSGDPQQIVFRGHGRENKASAYNGTAVPILGDGKYFATRSVDAKKYGPNEERKSVGEIVKNPMVIRSDDDWRALTKEAGWAFPNPSGMPEADVKSKTEKLREIVTSNGHDGIIVTFPDSPYDGDGNRWWKLLAGVFGHSTVVSYGPQVVKESLTTQADATSKSSGWSATPDNYPFTDSEAGGPGPEARRWLSEASDETILNTKNYGLAENWLRSERKRRGIGEYSLPGKQQEPKEQAKQPRSWNDRPGDLITVTDVRGMRHRISKGEYETETRPTIRRYNQNGDRLEGNVARENIIDPENKDAQRKAHRQRKYDKLVEKAKSGKITQKEFEAAKKLKAEIDADTIAAPNRPQPDTAEASNSVGKALKSEPQTVAGKIEKQLADAGQFTDEQRRDAGAFVQAFYDEKARQLGVTSDELYRKFPYKIEVGDTAAAGLRQETMPDTINIDGVERPTKNSEGKPIHPTEAGVRNFWKWFGDSKVVDEQGRPMAVYHGTSSDFFTFDGGELGRNTRANSAKKGIFFASNPETASSAYYATASTEMYDDRLARILGVKTEDINATLKEILEVRGWHNSLTKFDADFTEKYSKEVIDDLSALGVRRDDYTKSSQDVFDMAFSDNPEINYPIVKELVDKKNQDIIDEDVYDFAKRMIDEYRKQYEKKTAITDYFNDAQFAFKKFEGTAIGDDYNEARYEGITPKPNVMPVYVKIENPRTYDYGGEKYRDVSYSEQISIAEQDGNDGVVLKNTYDGGKQMTDIIIAFSPTQIKSATGNSGKFGGDPSILRQLSGKWYYSALQRAFGGAKQESMPAGQWAQWLAGNAGKLGVKADEIRWSGVGDWLMLKGKEKVSKTEISEYLKQNGVQVEEVMKGEVPPEPTVSFEDGKWVVRSGTGKVFGRYSSESDALAAKPRAVEYSLKPTKYAPYVLPGGKNYRELLLTLPVRDAQVKALERKYGDDWLVSATEEEIASAQKENAVKGTFKSSHWDEPNVLAHIRFNERTDSEGKKVLFIEEIQSDWGQSGKKSVFGKIPDAPFVTETKAWVSLALKRMIRYAAENGYDKVAFVNGEQSAERYDLSKQIKSIDAYNTEDGQWEITMVDNNGIKHGQGPFEENKLSDYVGNDLAKKIIDDGGGIYSGLDLRVGGEGMKAFYDQIVPQVASGIVKKYGGNIEKQNFIGKPRVLKRGNEYQVWSDKHLISHGETEQEALSKAFANQNGFTITPKMREAAMSGLPLFQSGGVRGGFSPERLTAILNQKSDFSTFVHETGHAYLDMLGKMASSENAPKQIKFDMDVLLRWFGVKDLSAWNKMPLEEQRKHHEAFAYNFELYASEGKAPNSGLRGVFERFRDWMKAVYQNIKEDLNAAYRKETGEDLPILTGEVRGVMDRMLANKPVEFERGPSPEAFRYGAETPILAGGKQFGRVRYALVERKGLIASHNPNNFTENANYPQERQNRDYTNIEVRGKAEDAIEGIRSNKFMTVLQPAVESDTGMPTITPRGVVLSGNNRTFSILRHYGEYRAELNKTKLSPFGLTASDVGALQEPILVRVFDDPKAEAGFVIASNEQRVKTVTAAEIRRHYKALPDDQKQKARRAVSGIYREFNLGDIARIDTFLGSLKLSELPTMVLRNLKESGALSESDMQANGLTSTGIEKVKMMALTLLNEDMDVPERALDFLSANKEGNGNLDRKFDAAIGDLFAMRDEIPEEAPSEMADLGKALERRIAVLGNPEPYRAQTKELSMQKAIRGASSSEEALTANQAEYYRALASDVVGALRKVAAQKVSRQEDLFGGVMGSPSRKSPVLQRERKTKGIIAPDEIVKAIEKMTGTPIQIGKGFFAQRKANGWFNPSNDLIRVKQANKLDTMAHEAGHSVHGKILKWFDDYPIDVKQELFEIGKALYGKRKPNGGYVREGFAEFFAKKIMGQDVSEYQTTEAWFESQVLEKHHDLKESFYTTAALFEQWEAQGAYGRIAGMVHRIEPGIKGKALTAWEKLSKTFSRRMWINDAAPLERVVDDLIKRTDVELKPTENPAMMRAALKMSAQGTARRFILDHAVNRSGDIVGKSLIDYLKPIKSQLEEFTVYALSKRSLDLHRRGIDPGISKSDAEYAVETLQSKEFDDALSGLTEWSNYLIDYVVECGGLSPDAAKAMRDLNPVYVPLKRYFDETHLGGARGIGSKLSSGIKRIKGSGRRIIDPVDSFMQQAEQMIRFGNEMMVVNSIASAVEKVEKDGKDRGEILSVGWFANKVQAPGHVDEFSIADIARQLEEIGVDLADADMEQVLRVFSSAQRYTGKQNIISIIRNGKREFWEIDPAIYETIMEMDKDHLPALFSFLIPAKRLVQLGAVGVNASFGVIKNPIRDTIDRAVYGQRRSHPFDTLANGFFEELRHGRYSELWKNLGGELSTLMGQDRIATQRLLEEGLAETKKENAIQVLKHPIDALRSVLSFYESAPRIAEFKAVLEKAEEKYGAGSLDARIEALLASKDVTVNFTRSGIISQALNGIIPFFNAAIQGSSKFVRAFDFRNDGKAAARAFGAAFAYITVPSLLLFMLNKDEDWYEELNKYERLAYWHFSPDSGKTIFRVPKPFQIGYVFGSVPEAVLYSAYKQNPDFVNEALLETAKGFLPADSVYDLLPALVKPSVEVAANYDSFQDRAIVPYYEEKGKLPKDQYGKGTTETAKAIGAVIGVSPRKVEHILRNQTGGLAMNSIRNAEAIFGARKLGRNDQMADLPVIGTLFSRNPYYSGRTVNKVYEFKAQLEQKAGSGNLTPKERYQLKKLNFAAKKMKLIRKRLDAGEISYDDAAIKLTNAARMAFGMSLVEKK